MVPQHEVARLKANEHRLRRAALRREVKAATGRDGLRHVAELLLDPPAEIGTLSVFEMLRWVRRVHAGRAAEILRDLGVPATRTVGRLTDRERHQLAAFLMRESL